LGFSPNSRSDISIGPVVRYTSTDTAASPFVAQQQLYGSTGFAQTGVHLAVHLDTRSDASRLGRIATGSNFFEFGGDDNPPVWGKITLNASAYPGMLDERTAYEKVGGALAAFITAPVLTRPVLALRAGGEKLYGDFPYFDAAFIGGSRSLRTEHRQRFAGDASLYGTTELRVPLARFPLILPLNVGALGFVDVARVYQNGESPGGWHQGSGAGFWLGAFRPDFSVTVMRTNNPDRRSLVGIGFDF
jgi:outer membrane protein assembly factor BamA